MNVTLNLLSLIQIFFAVVIGLYFLNLLKSQQGSKVAVDRESRKEMEKLQRMREISLTQPLAEKTRPASFEEIVGQSDGLKALRAALCGPNPQHVIIYGPPGIGKTAAARLVLEEAKKTPGSPFKPDAKFVEVDATIARFDERGIADPLIGSVHDPIYQGAGPLGIAGIPQPKPGAVTKAHGGVLFIDEIGELHPIQMNKLLKVLEDRKVFLESAYYSSEDTNIPRHIHEIFQNGLPADFRLIGATTRTPEEIPPAIRSRCLEIYFQPLSPEDIGIIAQNAVKKINFEIDDLSLNIIKKYATNGREAVNIIQMAAGLAMTENRRKLEARDVEWVINSGQYPPRPEKKIGSTPQIGLANGLAVYGPNMGTLLEIETTAIPTQKGHGTLSVTGVVEEEEMGGNVHKLRRKGTARGSVDNVMTVLRKYLGVDPKDYDIHLNLPGGIPIDGPSAGVTIATSIYSAITNIPVNNEVAMTGELSVRGYIKPIGGVVPKIEAARRAGVKTVIIPKENWQEMFKTIDLKIIAVDRIEEVIEHALVSAKYNSNFGVKSHFPAGDSPAPPLSLPLSSEARCRRSE
ncbi:MAG: ATP-dependent Lon protease [Thermoanaerobacteraceae bacterium]|uniref:endopeptidase La n=1 Tax=Biomaibacter acetigenes TaxID=2316383 RepID=A0A3G2R304_9FIRM|nr:ATP-dependent protease LonB [Biomaibacter acetigenes]AYO29853.1 ATP-dependent protease LonB [Biomaibacter acetigenes]MDK2877989.1 ATP-dependent Lon protease [Thermoanaerobacteraceae bacterium]MDN5301304.1 ATP-dependent Lon protease [Thermoanaerobacteraceae bacterium]RKL64386.1 ATP-dependent protease LonB [Thermoanaerobacteraceae bacterium SP2]